MVSSIEQLRVDIGKAARKLWGDKWITPLAIAAKWNERTLRTFLRRGKRLPPGDKLERLLRAVGVVAPYAEWRSDPLPPGMLPSSALYPKGRALPRLTTEQRAMAVLLSWALMDICESFPHLFKGLAAEIIRMAPHADKKESRRLLAELLVLPGKKKPPASQQRLDHDA